MTNKYPTGKSIFWIFNHKQENLFIIFFSFFTSLGCAFLAVRFMEKSPAGIIFFVIATYGIYFFISNVIKLYKEFKK